MVLTVLVDVRVLLVASVPRTLVNRHCAGIGRWQAIRPDRSLVAAVISFGGQLACVVMIAAGDSWLDPAVPGRVLRSHRSSAPTTPSDNGVVDALTPRELEVLRAMAIGRSNGEIAADLVISELTVKSHIGRIFTKLRLRDRPAAIAYACDHGLVSPATI